MNFQSQGLSLAPPDFSSSLQEKPTSVQGLSLKIAWFYPKQLNLYGDRGNVEILVARAKARGIFVEVVEIDLETPLNSSQMEGINLVFMGGGPDLDQQKIYSDFIQNKGPYLKEYLNSGGVGLFICGSYQLLGNYYKSADGTVIKGLELLDLYTESFGKSKPRSIGNVTVEINPDLLSDPVFAKNNKIGSTLVGFENHGGRTYFPSLYTEESQKFLPLGHTKKEFGNNEKDTTEGILYKNTIGTYLHGPVLARNPHLADYLIAKSIKMELLPFAESLESSEFLESAKSLERLDNSVIVSAHEKSKKLKR